MSDLPDHERPRERLLASGAEALADRELIGVLLSVGVSGSSAVDLADRLIAGFGGLRQLATVDPAVLARVHGVGAAKAARLSAAFQLARRLDVDPGAARVRCGEDLALVARPLLYGLSHERVVVVACDPSGRVLRASRLTEGVADRCLVPTRDVLGSALAIGGVSFGVAHNHPSGSLRPSASDVGSTHRLAAGAETVGLAFLGHVIVTDNAWAPVTDPLLN